MLKENLNVNFPLLLLIINKVYEILYIHQLKHLHVDTFTINILLLIFTFSLLHLIAAAGKLLRFQIESK